MSFSLPLFLLRWPVLVWPRHLPPAPPVPEAPPASDALRRDIGLPTADRPPSALDLRARGDSL